MRLEGRTAIVTGAASGMGRSIAELFTKEGASVVATDWNGDRLEEVVSSIEAEGGEITGVQGDIANRATAEELVATAIDRFGGVGVVVNNAGVMDYMQGVGEVDDDVWRRVFAINLDGPMYLSREALPHMLEQGYGSIVNVASTAGISGGAAGAAYTASKHALVGLTKNTAWMYAQRGIRCNAICPGGTRTNIAESMPQEKLDPQGGQRAQAFAALIPATLDPIDIAYLALYLAADESKLINGAIIPADGGWKAV